MNCALALLYSQGLRKLELTLIGLMIGASGYNLANKFAAFDLINIFIKTVTASAHIARDLLSISGCYTTVEL